MAHQSIVTSVPDPSSFAPVIATSAGSPFPTHTIHLELRNQRFAIDREALIELPESILLCLFPNGVVLSQKQSTYPPPENHLDSPQDPAPHDVYYVDFDAPCLSFILKFFNQARLTYYGTTARPAEPLQLYSHIPSPLFYRQAVIVLREELEYFAIQTPRPQPSDSEPQPRESLASHQKGSKKAENLLLGEIKRTCGDLLLADMSIFTALQRNVERENNVAEKHLIDMLCMSGFDRADNWGYRTLEPRRCAISSLALVLLKTGIIHDQGPDSAGGSTSTASPVQMTGPSNISRMTPQVDNTQLNTAQKLLLFWRKPARKCWWDATELELNLSDNQLRVVKLWARRVWTLELSLI